MTPTDLCTAGRWQEAVDLVESMSGPVGLDVVIAYSNALEMVGRVEDSVNVLLSLHEVTPRWESAVWYVSALCRLGLRNNPQVDRLIGLYPECEFLKAGRSEQALQDGDLATGFALAKHRWAIKTAKAMRTTLPCPEWDGVSTDGRLLVIGEQGLGEEILFSSQLSWLRPAVVGADPRLVPLLARSFPRHEFVPKAKLAEMVTDGDAYVEAMDLMRIGKATGNSSAWLIPDMARAAHYRGQLETEFTGKALVGLSWFSSRQGLGDSKSIPPADLMPLVSSQRAVFLNLQYGEVRIDSEVWERTGCPLYAIDGLDVTNDLDGLASLIAALDVVVTCSNTTAHLAGAMGKRTILMAPGGRFVLWYWGRDGNRTPWYPSVEILRGPPRVSWADLSGTVEGML